MRVVGYDTVGGQEPFLKIVESDHFDITENFVATTISTGDFFARLKEGADIDAIIRLLNEDGYVDLRYYQEDE